MDLERQRGFLLDGEDPPKGCRKSYFLEFMNVDVPRDFVGVVFHVLLMVPRAPKAIGTVVVLSPHIRFLSLCIC